MIEANARSIYADRVSVHKERARNFLVQCVTYHGQHQPGSTLYFVSENEFGVRGYFIAMLSPFYIVGDMLEANDVHCYMADNADKKDFLRMLRAYNEWVDENPKVIEAKLSDSDFIKGMERVGLVYERMGYVKTHSVYSRKIDRLENAS